MSVLENCCPLRLVTEVFGAFVDTLLFLAHERPAQHTGARLQADSTEFLAALTRSVYWEYPREVRLPDRINPVGRPVPQYSFVDWNNLRQFRACVFEALRDDESWNLLQRAIVEFAEAYRARSESPLKATNPRRKHLADVVGWNEVQ